MPPTPATTLRPRWALPLALFAFAFVVGWPAFGVFKFGPAREQWWGVVFLGMIAAAFLYLSAHEFVTRWAWVMEVSDDGFEVLGNRIGRSQVTRIARHVDSTSKGVRIELEGGAWIKIPVHLHRPRKVLAAFKRHGYPVGGAP